MKHVLGAAGVCLLFVVSLAAWAGPQDFTLVNDTGLTIDELYISPTHDDEWQEDVLGVDVLNNGGHVDITFPYADKTDCAWDLKIVDEDGDAVVWEGIDLCAASEITLHYANKRPTADIK